MYCGNCGKKLEDVTAAFCPYCGAAVNHGNKAQGVNQYASQKTTGETPDFSQNGIKRGKVHRNKVVIGVCALAILIVGVIAEGRIVKANAETGSIRQEENIPADDSTEAAAAGDQGTSKESQPQTNGDSMEAAAADDQGTSKESRPQTKFNASEWNANAVFLNDVWPNNVVGDFQDNGQTDLYCAEIVGYCAFTVDVDGIPAGNEILLEIYSNENEYHEEGLVLEQTLNSESGCLEIESSPGTVYYIRLTQKIGLGEYVLSWECADTTASNEPDEVESNEQNQTTLVLLTSIVSDDKTIEYVYDDNYELVQTVSTDSNGTFTMDYSYDEVAKCVTAKSWSDSMEGSGYTITEWFFNDNGEVMEARTQYADGEEASIYYTYNSEGWVIHAERIAPLEEWCWVDDYSYEYDANGNPISSSGFETEDVFEDGRLVSSTGVFGTCRYYYEEISIDADKAPRWNYTSILVLSRAHV